MRLHLTIGAFFLGISSLAAAQDAFMGTAETFKVLIKDLQNDLERKKIPDATDREQIYDVIGGLKVCQSVLQGLQDPSQSPPTSESSKTPETSSSSTEQSQKEQKQEPFDAKNPPPSEPSISPVLQDHERSSYGEREVNLIQEAHKRLL